MIKGIRRDERKIDHMPFIPQQGEILFCFFLFVISPSLFAVGGLNGVSRKFFMHLPRMPLVIFRAWKCF